MDVRVADAGELDVDDDIVIIRFAALESVRGERARGVGRGVTSGDGHGELHSFMG